MKSPEQLGKEIAAQVLDQLAKSLEAYGDVGRIYDEYTEQNPAPAQSVPDRFPPNEYGFTEACACVWVDDHGRTGPGNYSRTYPPAMRGFSAHRYCALCNGTGRVPDGTGYVSANAEPSPEPNAESLIQQITDMIEPKGTFDELDRTISHDDYQRDRANPVRFFAEAGGPEIYRLYPGESYRPRDLKAYLARLSTELEMYPYSGLLDLAEAVNRAKTWIDGTYADLPQQESDNAEP